MRISIAPAPRLHTTYVQSLGNLDILQSSAANNTIRARVASRTTLVRELANVVSLVRSWVLNIIVVAMRIWGLLSLSSKVRQEKLY